MKARSRAITLWVRETGIRGDALQLGALREALLDAGADVVKANAASEAVAAYEDRLVHVGADLRVLKWMVGANLTISLGVLGRLLFIH